MKLLSPGIAFTLAVSAIGARASDSAVALQVTVFPCAADAAVAPSLRVISLKQPVSVVKVAPEWQRSGDLWQGSLALDAGRYILNAESPHCSGGVLPWMAIPGAQRRVALTINKIKSVTLDEDQAPGLIYGSLPAPGAVVEVARSDRPSERAPRSAPIDGDTYQINYLRPGRYVVSIAFGEVAVQREVTIGRSVSAMTVRADLTPDVAADIVRQQAAGSHFIHVRNAQNSYSTSFQLGAASADGWTYNPSADSRR